MTKLYRPIGQKTLWPKGSIYISVINQNPSKYFGGTWEQIKDRFLLACGNTYSNGSTGGSATHKLKESELPKLEGTIQVKPYDNYSGTGILSAWVWEGQTKAGALNTAMQTPYGIKISFGGNGSHNNMPPYIAVYMWKRTA